MEKEEKGVLKENVINFFNSAELVYKTNDYNSAITLYFKALFSILDFIILNKLNKTPKDHTARFIILKSRFPEYYVVLDKLFPIYRGTYSRKTNKEDCNYVRIAVRDIIKKQRIFESN